MLFFKYMDVYFIEFFDLPVFFVGENFPEKLGDRVAVVVEELVEVRVLSRDISTMFQCSF